MRFLFLLLISFVPAFAPKIAIHLMPRHTTLKIPAQNIQDEQFLKKQIAKATGIPPNQIQAYQIIRQSTDARKRPILFELQLIVFEADEMLTDYFAFEPKLQPVGNAPEVFIAGCGPAGMFAALELIKQGLKPIILERGKDIKSRRRDLAAMNKEGIVNPESNYCYGEGGAGTYSDGKLYTRSGKRGNILECLQWFRYFGADENILYKAHPHIGTNKLPHIIEAMRQQIIACGGEVRFDTKLTNLFFGQKGLTHIELNGDSKVGCHQLILATGHSARDIFLMLERAQIAIKAKPFALGVRIEHPQELINEIQYKCGAGDPILDVLGAASYSLVSQEAGRGVFSFCMCPGGIIAPASTEPGALVVNGWSPSRRNGAFANSGMVVTVDIPDFQRYGFAGNLAGMHFQNMVEEKAWEAGGGHLQAPAQRMTDFVNRRKSSSLPDCSYLPGVNSALLSEVLPEEVYESLRAGMLSFGTKLRGYLTSDAIVTATESRTSSPVRIPRNTDTLAHPQIEGLYPCGEGAGYAGGIISAAMDGMRVAKQLSEKMKGENKLI